MLVLKDGRAMLAWIELPGDSSSDWGGARISAKISNDCGATWDEKFTLRENIGAMNVMAPDLPRLKSGRRLPADGADLSGRREIVLRATADGDLTPQPSYTGFNHGRAMQLKSGRRNRA